MKNILTAALGLALLTLVTSFDVGAVDGPHADPAKIVNPSCTSCHNSSLPSDSATFNSNCLTCHSDFNTGKNSAAKLTSHKWTGNVANPAAGAQSPTTGALSQVQDYTGSQLACVNCHNPHANGNGKYLRIANGTDQLCLDCHRSRNTPTAAAGSHPVLIGYSSAAKAAPDKFVGKVPLNANPANPTSDLGAKLGNDGKLLCSTCHGVHSADSRSSNYVDGFKNVSSGDGNLLRTNPRGDKVAAGETDKINICTNCHAGKMNHNGIGQDVQCIDCHGAHVEYDSDDPAGAKGTNINLIRRNVTTSGQPGKIYFRTAEEYINTDGAGPGVCQGCHSAPTTGTHAGVQPTDCKTCHTHNSAKGSFSPSCGACHGYPPAFIAHSGAAHPDNSNCSICHNTDPALHKNGHVDVSMNCDACHGSTAIASGAHPAHLAAIYGTQMNSQGVPNACRNCHTYTNELGLTHIDGAIQAPIAGCTISCHRNTIPSWISGRVSCESCHTGNLSVINGFTAPFKAKFTVSGHGQTGANYNASRSCVSCHDGNSAHISGNPGTNKRIAVNDNTLCASCHNDQVKVPTAAKRNLPSHVAARFGDPVLVCNSCHDVHGTTNLASIKTKITFGNLSGNITYTDSVNGFVQNVAPYRGLCQVCHTQTSHYRAGQAETTHNQTSNCLNCHRHNDSYAFRPHGGTMTNAIYLKDSAGNYLTTADSGTDGKYNSLPPYSAAKTCGPCHKEILASEHLNFHASLGSAASGRNSDPSQPWVQGSGVVGKWCPGANRQLADLKATYASEAEFLAKVDMGVYEFVKECSSCHVGGGIAVNNSFGFTNWLTPAGEPGSAHTRLDDATRAASLSLDESQGSHSRVPLNSWDYYVDNGAVKRADWTKSGVLEQDCMICHLAGYNLQARNEQIVRYGNFVKADAAGVFFATDNKAVSGPNSFDYSDGYVKKDASNRLYLASFFTSYYINKYPPMENCAACHMPIAVSTAATGFLAAAAVPSSDPTNPDPLVAANKKPARMREDFLTRGENMQSSRHWGECGLCHTSELGEASGTYKYQAWDPLGNRGGDASRYQHGPGTGTDPQFTAGTQRESVKSCEECHMYWGNYLKEDGTTARFNTGGAPYFTVAHYNAGLEAKIVPTAMRIKDGTGAIETFMGNHIDVLSCTACHLAKRSTVARSYDFSTGGDFVNLLGNPIDQGGVGSVLLAYSWKDNMGTKVFSNGQPNPRWRRQIFPFNYVTAISWNNIGTADANGDGYLTGQPNGGIPVSADPFFSRTIREQFDYGFVNSEKDAVPSGLKNDPVYSSRSAWAVAGQAGGVMFTQPGEINTFKAALGSVNPGYRPQLSLAAEPYLVSHNVQWDSTLGKTGCTDCHNNSAGVINGSYDLLGTGKRISDGAGTPLSVSWSAPDDVKAQARAWDRNLNSLTVDFADQVTKTTRAPARWEFLGYDATRVQELNAITAAQSGIGVKPVAIFTPLADIDATVPGTQVVKDATYQLVAELGQPGDVGLSTYKWTSNDGTVIAEGRVSSVTFTTTGMKIIYLKVFDEEGNVAVATQEVNVIVPVPDIISWSDNSGNLGGTLTLTPLPSPNDMIRITWGDGLYNNVATADAVTTSKAHTYTAAGSKLIQIYVYKSGISQGYFKKYITVDGAN